jgi:outer membrane protein OmpA-like peptidoglycan-associated protein
LYFDNNSPSINEQKDYEAIHQEYYQKKELYKEKGGEPAAAFFEEELKSEFETFEDIAEYIYYCLQLKKKVRISFKGYSSKLGSSQYNEQLSKRRIQSIKEYLLQYKGGVLKDYIQNQQLELVEVSLGYNNSNLSGTEDKIKAIYSSEAAKDRKVELTIEEIK